MENTFRAHFALAVPGFVNTRRRQGVLRSDRHKIA
jgi:hypothetical protein